jgi:hypothetical protein
MDSSKFINEEVYMYCLVNVWIIVARQCVSPEVTVKGFGKCCTSSAVGGTDDGMLWKGSEEDGNVRSECEEDEGTDCEDGDSDTDW